VNGTDQLLTALLVQSVNTVRQTHATLATSVKFSVFTP
jgi:hypothetical protein